MLRHLECRILELLEILLRIWWVRLGSMFIVGLYRHQAMTRDGGR